MDTRIKAVAFDEKAHRYWYNGKELFGVTGAIGKIMGKQFPEGIARIELSTIYGSDIHKEIENYYNEDSGIISTEGAKWVVEELDKFKNTCKLDPVKKIECEKMVSDFEGTASKVDVVAWHESGKATLFDIKTTSEFHREYCSLQLSVYKRLFEANYETDVLGMFVLGTQAKRSFRIIQQPDSKVNKILCMNRVKE